jgi:hypothetical protein
MDVRFWFGRFVHTFRFPLRTWPTQRAEGMKPQSMGTTIAAIEDVGMVER